MTEVINRNEGEKKREGDFRYVSLWEYVVNTGGRDFTGTISLGPLDGHVRS